MVSMLERAARQYRANRFIKEAEELERRAEVYRKRGVPNEFPGEAASEQFLGLEEARAQILKILSTKQFKPDEPRLTPELAREINQIGKHLEDGVELKYLRIHSEGVNQIDRGLQRAYNRAVSALVRPISAELRYRTLGEIRDTDLYMLTGTPNLFRGSVGFF